LWKLPAVPGLSPSCGSNSRRRMVEFRTESESKLSSREAHYACPPSLTAKVLCVPMSAAKLLFLGDQCDLEKLCLLFCFFPERCFAAAAAAARIREQLHHPLKPLLQLRRSPPLRRKTPLSS